MSELLAVKAKFKAVLHAVAMVAYFVRKMIPKCSPMIWPQEAQAQCVRVIL